MKSLKKGFNLQKIKHLLQICMVPDNSLQTMETYDSLLEQNGKGPLWLDKLLEKLHKMGEN